MRLFKKIIGVAAYCFAAYGGSIFAETETQYWPEAQFHHRLNEQFRIRLVVGVTRSRPLAGESDGFVEGDLDIGLKSIKRIVQLDEHKDKYLSMRLGYSYHESFSDENPPAEHRASLEFTARYPLPYQFLAINRNRMDFRSIGGEQSRRYRNRVRIERSCAIGKLQFSPYGQAEFYYDSRVNGWNRNEYSIGSEFPIGKHVVLEFYYLYQNNRGLGSTDVNGFGNVLQLYW